MIASSDSHHFFLILLLASACPGSSGDTESDAGTMSETSSATGGGEDCPSSTEPLCATAQCTPLPSHSADIQPFWNALCVKNCHLPPAPFANLDLSAPLSYSQIVDVGSSQVGMDLVEPGSPYESYLWHKIFGTQACPGLGGTGEKMPPGIDPDDPNFALLQTTVTNWICCGATP